MISLLKPVVARAPWPDEEWVDHPADEEDYDGDEECRSDEECRFDEECKAILIMEFEGGHSPEGILQWRSINI